jgi:hypothetical protein
LGETGGVLRDLVSQTCELGLTRDALELPAEALYRPLQVVRACDDTAGVPPLTGRRLLIARDSLLERLEFRF